MPQTVSQRVTSLKTLYDNVISAGHAGYTINGRTWRPIDLPTIRAELEYWEKLESAEAATNNKRGVVGYFQKES